MNQQEKEHNKQTQELEAECYQTLLLEMYHVMLHPNRYKELWEKAIKVRDKYLQGLKNIS